MTAVLDSPATRHRFSRIAFDRMVELGVFQPEDRIELLDGEIIDMAPQKSRHATAVRLVETALRGIFTQGFDVRSQLPICLNDYSEPEPDIAVVRGAPRDYRDAHPTTALLIVEIADTSLSYDRQRKLAAYARAGVAEYWILDLNRETLEICRQPNGDDYNVRILSSRENYITPLAATNDDKVAVADLLP